MRSNQWPLDKVQEWYSIRPWLVGCNFISSTAINQLEMWQEETWDAETIDKELRWASALGMNTIRVYLHDLLWEHDSQGFIQRIDRFLFIASSHQIKTLFVLFDDCWNGNPQIGKQPDPVPGVHNSGWLKSPGNNLIGDRSKWSILEKYVKEVIAHFSFDNRILGWDLYNEPGNGERDNDALELLKRVFKWARESAPNQPCTVGVWSDKNEFNEIQLDQSDIISFHNYGDLSSLQKIINSLQKRGRPMICTEYMARTNKSFFTTHLPVFKKRNIGCYNWGLVSGKTNTIFPWESAEGTPDPEVWFHDIFRKDGSAFDEEELVLFRKLTGDTSLES